MADFSLSALASALWLEAAASLWQHDGSRLVRWWGWVADWQQEMNRKVRCIACFALTFCDCSSSPWLTHCGGCRSWKQRTWSGCSSDEQVLQLVRCKRLASSSSHSTESLRRCLHAGHNDSCWSFWSALAPCFHFCLLWADASRSQATSLGRLW